jgi:hypothetical protein
MSDAEANMWEELEALPPTPRAGLTFAGVALVSEEAARAALDEVADGHGERARGALEKHLLGMLPPTSLDTPDAWARRGAYSGAVAAWGTVTGTLPQYWPPRPCPSTTHATMHMCAWQLAATIVMGVRCE